VIGPQTYTHSANLKKDFIHIIVAEHEDEIKG
jgi:hypothetical protein